jgi:hypothetical protein
MTENKYANALIYIIYCSQDIYLNDLYVGSTIDLKQRRKEHKSNSKLQKTNHIKLYKYINDNGGFKNFEMVVIEQYPCKSFTEMRIREQFHFDQLHATLNTYRPMTTDIQKKKIKKIYNEVNQDKIKEFQKSFYVVNQDKIKERRKTYYVMNKEKFSAKYQEKKLEKQRGNNELELMSISI